MPTVLLTAFDPYDDWQQNSSWLTLVELTKNLPETPQITTRRYPVELGELRRRLAKDLENNYDFAIHLGQAPGHSRVSLEALAINVFGPRDVPPESFAPVTDGGPPAYQTVLPLADWTRKLRRAGIPCEVSYHAGTYVCNAAFYLSHCLAQQQGLATRSALIHLPLDVSQVIDLAQGHATMPRSMSAAAVRLILDELAMEES